MGAEFIVAVNVIPSKPRRACVNKDVKPDEAEPPGIITVMMNTFDISSICRAEASLYGADVVIRPNTACYKPTDFAEAGALILQGEMAAIDAVLEIRQRMSQW